MSDAEIQALVARLHRLEAEAEHLSAENARLRAQLAEAEVRIAELVRQLFGTTAERLTPEQETQVDALRADLAAQAARPARHPLPVPLETETVTLEPARALCGCSGAPLQRIGEEVTEELDLIPARLIRQRIVRPKYACRCGEAGVAVAPAPTA